MREQTEVIIESWREAAACFDQSAVDFFPEPEDVAGIAAAKGLCAVCPVAGDCLTWAIETNQTQGIWGGYTAAERRTIRRGWLEDVRRAS